MKLFGVELNFGHTSKMGLPSESGVDNREHGGGSGVGGFAVDVVPLQNKKPSSRREGTGGPGFSITQKDRKRSIIGDIGFFNFNRGERETTSSINKISDMKVMAQRTPLTFLEEMSHQHPTLSLALSNVNNILWFDKSTEYEVYTSEAKDDVLTKEINQFLSRQSKEIGSFRTLHENYTTELYNTGMVFAEVTTKPWDETNVIPEPKGLDRIYPVQSKTILLSRTSEDTLQPYQYQSSINHTSLFGDAEKSDILLANGLTELDVNFCHWATINGRINNVHGTPIFASAINEIIADYAMVRDLQDAVRNAAWPRYKFNFDFTETFKIAKEVFGIEDQDDAVDFVSDRFDEALDMASKLPPDGNIVGPVDTLDAGNFAGVEPVLTFLRQRLAQACKTLPSLLGIQEGTASSYSSIEWGIYVSVLESVRHIICGFIAEILQHHLTALGIDSTVSVVVPKYRKLRINEELTEQNIMEVKIRNNATLVALGWISNDDACMELTGHKPDGTAIPNILETMFSKTTTADANQSKQNSKPNTTQKSSQG